jgi:AraC family cel operon transcriptional repressor
MIRFCDYNHDFKRPDIGIGFHYFNSNYKDLHTHNYWEVFLITNGSLYHEINGKTVELNKGDCCIIRPADVHVFNPKDAAASQHINIMATEKLMSELLNLISPKWYPRLLENQDCIKFKLSAGEYAQFSDLVDQLYALDGVISQTAVLKLFIIDAVKLAFIKKAVTAGIAGGDNSSKPDWIAKLVAKMGSQDFIDRPLSELCNDIPFSQVHINRLFKDAMGDTIGNYLNVVRFKYACRLLETTNFTILDISSRIGLSSLSYFTRTFKKKYGVTPKEYRHDKKNFTQVLQGSGKNSAEARHQKNK